MLSLFKTPPLIEDASAEWIYDAFEWALLYFDSDEFFSRGRLIQPSNEYFPGSVNNVHEKAENIFNHTIRHAGLSHWPFKLQPPQHFNPEQPPLLPSQDITRHSGESALSLIETDVTLALTYHPQQIMKAGDLAGSYAHAMAQHLVIQARQMPPGGGEYFSEGAEILAVAMGFGVLMANSAYAFRGGCGSCYNAMANRQAALSESEIVFALALYCRLKGIAKAEAMQYLKKYLKGPYKQALKQIDAEPERLAKLLSYRRLTSNA